MYAGAMCRRQVATCFASASIVQAAEQMRREHVGDLVVVEKRKEGLMPLGIVSERDIMVEVLARDVDPKLVTAGDIMSSWLVTAYEDEVLEVAMEKMRWAGMRRIPLVDLAGALVGILTLDDIVANISTTLLPWFT